MDFQLRASSSLIFSVVDCSFPLSHLNRSVQAPDPLRSRHPWSGQLVAASAPELLFRSWPVLPLCFIAAASGPLKISSPLVRSVGGSLSARASVPQLARLAALFCRRGLRFNSPLRSSFLHPQFLLSRFCVHAKAHWFLLI
jgi:hypothetical protein